MIFLSEKYRAVTIREASEGEKNRRKDHGLKYVTLYRHVRAGRHASNDPFGKIAGDFPDVFEVYGSEYPKLGSILEITIAPPETTNES